MTTSAIYNGHSTGGFTVNSGDTLYVYSGGAVSNVVVDSGGSVDVYSGGSATALTANGVMLVYGGGTAVATSVDSGGALVLLPGADVADTNPAGGAILSSGVVVLSGNDLLSAGTVQTGGTIAAGVTEYVLSSGTADGATVSGGRQIVYSGGLATSTTLFMGTATIASGGIASGTVVSLGGFEIVDTSGTVDGAVIVGSASGLVGGGILEVAGGLASGTMVGSGGQVEVLAGALEGGPYGSYGTGEASATTVESGGVLNVNYVGLAVGTTVLSGGEEIAGGGTLSESTVDSGGIELTVSGGTATGTMIGSGGYAGLDPGGKAFGVTVGNGGVFVVFNELGGYGPGATNTGTVVEPGGMLLNSGVALLNNNPLVSSGPVVAYGNHTLPNVTVLSGLTEFVFSQGTAVDTVVSGYGAQVVLSGGVASGSIAESGGYIEVFGGGSAVAPQNTSGGIVEVYSGGDIIGALNAASGSIEVYAGGTDILSPGATASGTVINPGGALAVSGLTLVSGTNFTAMANTTFNTTTFDGASITFDGMVDSLDATISSGGVETVSSGGLAAGSVISSGGVELLAAGGTASGTTLLSGGTLDLGFLVHEVEGSVTIDANDFLTISQGGVPVYTQLLSGSYLGEYFYRSVDEAGTGTAITVDDTPCYCRGTRILTGCGEIPVEELRIGDRLVTHGGVARQLIWIGTRSYDGRFIAGNRDALPILFRAGSLGDGVPARDLQVSPKHAMFLDDVLIPAELLVNGRSIVQLERVERVDYFHIELETHDILLAEGAPSESFIDHDSRLMFQNAAEHLLLHPQSRVIEDCAPRLEDGEVVEAVRRRIATRAGLASDHVDDDAADGPLNGRIDVLDGHEVSGWAFDVARPHTPVWLEILDGDRVIGTVVANRFRPDLRQAKLGEGRCAYVFRFEAPPPDLRAIRVRRANDRAVFPMPSAASVAA